MISFMLGPAFFILIETSIKKGFSNPKVKVLDGFMGKIKATQ